MLRLSGELILSRCDGKGNMQSQIDDMVCIVRELYISIYLGMYTQMERRCVMRIIRVHESFP